LGWHVDASDSRIMRSTSGNPCTRAAPSGAVSFRETLAKNRVEFSDGNLFSDSSRKLVFPSLRFPVSQILLLGGRSMQRAARGRARAADRAADEAVDDLLPGHRHLRRARKT